MWSACLTRWCKWWQCPRWVVEGCSLRVLQCELEVSGRHTRGWGYWGITDWESIQGPAEVHTTQQHVRANIKLYRTATHQHTTLYIHNTYQQCWTVLQTHNVYARHQWMHTHAPCTYTQWKFTVISCKRKEHTSNHLQDSVENDQIRSAHNKQLGTYVKHDQFSTHRLVRLYISYTGAV